MLIINTFAFEKMSTIGLFTCGKLLREYVLPIQQQDIFSGGQNRLEQYNLLNLSRVLNPLKAGFK